MTKNESARFVMQRRLLARWQSWLGLVMGYRPGQSDMAVFALSWGMSALFLVEQTLWGCDSFLLGSLAAVFHCLCVVVAIQFLHPRPALWKGLWPAIVCLAAMLMWRVVAETLRGQFLPRNLSFDRSAFEAKFVLEAGYDACFLAGAVLGFRRSGQSHSLRAMAVLGLIWQGLALATYHAGMVGDWGATERAGHWRFVATLGNANVAGIVFCMTSLLSLGAVIATMKTFHVITFGNRTKVFGLIGIGLLVVVMGFYGTLITQSRLASLLFILLTCVQLVFAMGTWAFSRRIVLPLLTLGVVMLLGGVATIFTMSDIQAVGDFVMKYDDMVLNVQGKAQDFWDFLNLSKQSPLFGFGPGTFEMANLASISSETVGRRWDYRSAHSILLGNALELGWPHVALELIFLVYCALTIARARAKALWNDRMRALGLALVCVAISGWVDIALDVPAVAAFSAWLLGLMVGKALSLKPHDFQPLAGKDGTVVVAE